MSTRRHNCSDDTSRHYRDVGVTRPSQETGGSSAITTPGSSSPTRNATYATPHVLSDDAPNRCLSESRIYRDAREQVVMEPHSVEPRRRSATSFARDQRFSTEGEGTKTKDESRLPQEGSQHRYDEVRNTDDLRNALREPHYPSLREDFEIHRPPLVRAKDVDPIIPPSANFQHFFEVQSRELSTLRNEHRAALEEKKALANTLATLKQQYNERSDKLTAVRHERQAALAQKKEIDEAYMALRQRYEEQTKKLSAVRHECQAALEQRQRVEEDYATLRQQYEAQRNEYNALSNKYNSLRATLEQRTSELQGIQKFLTTADTFSGSEVVNTLRKLNEEVQQSTTFMAEWAVENFTLETSPPDQTTTQSIEQTRVSEILGVRFLQLLRTKKHKDNPILMEMAFRAYLIYELYWVASPWSMGQEEHNAYIDAIYQRIREAEGQAISGNWRALTRAHTLPACISDPEVAHTFDTTIVSGFSDILFEAGFTGPKSDITAALWSKFGEKIHHFVSLAGQVSRIIGVGMVSEDFEVLVVWPDVIFDERTMEDSYDNGERVRGSEERGETVLCATELGLMQRISVGAGTRHKGKPSELVVIKPKVALVSVTDMIDE